MLTHTGTKTITTERLVLRRFAFDDVESVWRNWAGDKQVQNGYGEPVYETIEAAGELLARYIVAYKNLENYRWGVFLKEDPGDCVGQVAFFLVDSKNELCEIEYCMARVCQNKGYITEAVQAITVYGFETVGFNRVQVTCVPANTPSKRVIEKGGFVYEGTLRRFFKKGTGEYFDRMYFSLLREEYLRK